MDKIDHLRNNLFTKILHDEKILGLPSEASALAMACQPKPWRRLAEREGFEPSVPILVGTHDFQSCPFGQLGHLSVFHS